MSEKNVLIITDENEAIGLIAQSIKEELAGFNVTVIQADNFSGTDLLAAEIFFIGCAKPRPNSFAYLTQMLLHINLAGRKCGIFSTNEESLEYLAGLIKDCEADFGKPLMVAGAVEASVIIKEWLQEKINYDKS